MNKIDINCDLGESFGNYKIGQDAELMKHISSANIACGFHAGDPMVIKQTIEQAILNKLNIGAHPSYPDLQGFGRRSMKIPLNELEAMLIYQISAIKGITESLGGHLAHVKPHGALYNDAAQNTEISLAIINAVKAINPNIKLMGLSGSLMLQIAKDNGLATISEVFADRAYEDDGTLVSRNNKNAVIHDINTCNERVLQMVKNREVTTINGKQIKIAADSICIHGDNPNALNMVSSLTSYLKNNNILIGN